MNKQPSEKPTNSKDSADKPNNPHKGSAMKEYMMNGKKVRVVSLEELKRFSTRFGKISQFYFIGAILTLSAGIHFGQAGSVLLPKIFLGFLVFCVLMTLLSFRISYKAGKVVDMIGNNFREK